MPDLTMKTDIDLVQAFKDLRTVCSLLQTMVQVVETKKFNRCILDVAEGAQAILDVALGYSNLGDFPLEEGCCDVDQAWIGIVARRDVEVLLQTLTERHVVPTTADALALKICQLMTVMAMTYRSILYSGVVQRALERQREYPGVLEHDRHEPPEGYS